MRFYKRVEDGYLECVGIGCDGTEITEAEYQTLTAAIADKPAPPEGCDYRLREDLRWQLCVLPEPEAAPDTLDPAEALELICGTSTLTRAQAATYRTELIKSGTVADKPAIGKAEP